MKDSLYSVKLNRADSTGAVYDTVATFDALETDSLELFSHLEHFTSFNYPVLDGKDVGLEHRIWANDSVQVEIAAEPVDSTWFMKLVDTAGGLYGCFGAEEFLEDIDPKLIPIPDLQFKIFSVKTKKGTVGFSSTDFRLWFDPNVDATRCYVTDRGEIIVAMSNGNGAVHYYAFFVFDGSGKLIRKLMKTVI